MVCYDVLTYTVIKIGHPTIHLRTNLNNFTNAKYNKMIIFATGVLFFQTFFLVSSKGTNFAKNEMLNITYKETIIY